MRSKKWLTVMVLGLAILLLATTFSCGPKAAELPQAASIGTMPKGSLTNVMGASLGKVISAHTPMSVVDRPFSGYLSYIPLVNRGELDMGFVTSPELHYAYNGLAPYKEKNSNLRVIFAGTTLNVGLTVRLDSGIKTMADVRGKRYIVDSASMVTRQLVDTALLANGLDPAKDVTPTPLAGPVEGQVALREGRVDVVHAAVGMPAVKETVAKLGGIYWLPVVQAKDDAAANYIRQAMRGTDVKFWEAGKGPDIKNDTWTYDYAINIVTYQDFNDEAAYLMAKAIWENEAELVEIHGKFRGWQKQMVFPDVVIPYHDGAIRFYKEVGAWTAEMEQVQQKLLSQ